MLTLVVRRRLRRAASEEVHSGDRDERENQNAVADVAEQVAKPEAACKQSPKRRVAPALRVHSVTRATDRKRRENRACENIEPVEIDHFPRAPSWRSSSNSRIPWITNAQIAVGMAQTDN